MWIDEEVTYTPEIITVAKGQPIKVKIFAVGMDGTLGVRLPDGTEQRVEKRLCEKI